MGGEIVVADPFQRYRGLEIAADAPSANERAQVTYHIVGDLDLTQTSSVAQYAETAHGVIDDILRRDRLPIVTGGTGMYLRAALAELAFPGEVDPGLRADVEGLVTANLSGAIDELRRRDPGEAARIDLRNPRRVSRSLELARAGAARPTRGRLWADTTRHPTTLVGVTRPRATLDALITQRVRRELADGLVIEIEAALETPGISRAATQIIGVREVLALQAGETALSELPELLAARTRKLARAQLTWLRKTSSARELDLGDAVAVDALPRLLAMWDDRETHDSSTLTQ